MGLLEDFGSYQQAGEQLQIFLHVLQALYHSATHAVDLILRTVVLVLRYRAVRCVTILEPSANSLEADRRHDGGPEKQRDK